MKDKDNEISNKEGGGEGIFPLGEYFLFQFLKVNQFKICSCSVQLIFFCHITFIHR